MTLLQRVADMALIAQETGGSVMQMLEDAGIDCEEITFLADEMLEDDFPAGIALK